MSYHFTALMSQAARQFCVAGTAWVLLLTSVPAATADDESQGDVPSYAKSDAENSDKSILADENDERQPTVLDGRFVLPMLIAPTIDTSEIGNGRLPDGFRGDEEPVLQPLPESGQGRTENWNWTVANWSAANTFSYPRYFEDRMLERHGHERCGHFQPLASGARFFATVPMLPYLMTLRDPCDCESTLGYYRSGSCAPAMLQRPPRDRRAVIAEAAAVAGAIIVLP